MNQKKVAGIGIYEKGKYPGRIDGATSPEYKLWLRVMNRCWVGGVTQRNQPAYIGCTVHPDFIKFQGFAEWCHKQVGFDGKGFHLDKDILVPGNKVYGPDMCCFVPQSLNSLLSHVKSNNSGLPTGVSLQRGRYVVFVSIHHKQQYIGSFATPELASAAYMKSKSNEILNAAERWKDSIDPRVYSALVRIASEFI